MPAQHNQFSSPDSAQTTGYDARHLQSNDMEVGITDAVQKHVKRDVVPPNSVSQRKLDYEHARPRWAREMAAECLGVFFFVYPGIASQASFTLDESQAAFGSLFQIGWAYGLGIAFAVITCASTSGGHFNPALTICLAIWEGFPWKKVPRYIFAQILGSFLAALLLVGTYHPQLTGLKNEYIAQGKSLNSFDGPGAILTSFPHPYQNNYGFLFLTEWFVDSFIGIVIWAVLDPANPFIAETSAPFVIGLAYANMIWGFAHATLSTNLARDLGTRMVAAVFYGGDAFGKYSIIALLVNIPATIFATGVYELVLRDSFAIIAGGHKEHENGKEGLVHHLTKTGTLQEGNPTKPRSDSEVSEAGTYHCKENESPV